MIPIMDLRTPIGKTMYNVYIYMYIYIYICNWGKQCMGTLQADIRWWRKLLGFLTKMLGCEANPFDTCVRVT